MTLSRWLWLSMTAPLLAVEIPIELRARTEVFKGSGEWREVRIPQSLESGKTAIVVCDMWDNHWCSGAAQRVGVLAKKMDPLLEAARQRGIQIIHAPSETMAFYESSPQRKRILAVGRIEPPPPLDAGSPPLPIDDRRGGCDTTADGFYKAWSRQQAGLRIGDEDVISDSGPEIYSFLKERGITNLLVMGVHTNMCVLNRTFAIKRMSGWGVKTILVRDMTDAMYNPGDRPYVSHDEGTDLVIQYIEKFWAPSTTSAELLRGLQKTK